MNENHKMNVWQLTILTAVNMMGSGIIMLPSNLAEFGGISIVSWLVTAVGSMCLAYAFSKCGMFSKKSGGMTGYAEYSFGKAGNFLCNYVYSVSILVSNVAIAISAVGYGCTFFGIELTPIMTCVYTIFVIWLTTVFNFWGPEITGRISGVTVWGVLIPIFTISTVGWFFFSGDMYVSNWNIHDLPFSEAALNSITMTLWAFLGLESACVNADAVENPEKSVPFAVMGGTLGCAVVYILSTNVMFGILPAAEISASSAPFGLAFATMFGPIIGKTVMGLMCVACLGSLFGWQFTGANMYKGAAEFGFYPKIFAKVTSKGAPVIGMIIAGSIQTGLALMTISPSLNKQFEALVNLAVILNVIPYFLCMAAMVVIMKAAGHGSPRELRLPRIAAFIGSVYTLYACWSAGMDAMTYGSLLAFFGWTLYGFVSDRFDLQNYINE